MLTGYPLSTNKCLRTLDVVARKYDVDSIADWLFRHAKPLVEALDDHGKCRFCGAVGVLPGAELFSRSPLRRLANWKWQDHALTTYTRTGGWLSAGTFSLAHDLVPGVCSACAHGWMKNMLDDPTVSRLGFGGPIPFPQEAQAAVAAWTVRAALLRTAFEAAIDPAWVTTVSADLRTTGMCPPTWTVLAGRTETASFDAGQTAWLTRSETGRPVMFQYTVRFGGLVLLALWGGSEDARRAIFNTVYGDLAAGKVVPLATDAFQEWPPGHELGVLEPAEVLRLDSWLPD